MKERKEVISKGVENVICTMGTQSKKPNQVIMSVPDDFIIEALDFYKKKRMNLIGDTGLVRFELVAVYAEEGNFSDSEPVKKFLDGIDESGEQKIQDMSDELDEVLEGGK